MIIEKNVYYGNINELSSKPKMMTYEELMNRVEATERMDPKLRTNYIKSLFTIYLNEPPFPPPENQVRQEEETEEEEEEEEQGICLICGGESYHPNSQTCQRDGTCSNQNVDRDERMPEDGEECVNRFLEMVRERGLDYLGLGKNKNKYYRIGTEACHIGLANCIVGEKDRPGILIKGKGETLQSQLGWTRKYSTHWKYQGSVSYDMIGKPVSEIYDIIDKIKQCNN